MAGGALWARVPTIWAKFLLILIPSLVGSTLVFASVFFYTKYTDTCADVAAKVGTIADTNAATLAGSLWAFDINSTKNIVSTVSVNPEVVCAAAVDDLEHETYSWPATGCEQTPAAGSGEAWPSVTREIRFDGRHIGRLTLYYSYKSIKRQINQEIFNAVWLLLLLLLVTVVTALIAHRLTIGIPLQRLIDSIRHANQKGGRALVDWQSNDELGNVIAAYNRMLVKLAYEEVALRKSEERLSLAITATRCSVWDMDLTNGLIWWSAEFPQILGYGADQLPMVAATIEALMHPEDHDHVLSESLRHIVGETSTYSNIYRLRAKSGEYRWIEDRATAIRDSNGVALRLTGIISDITERKQVELELAHERAILQATLENVEQGIVMFDQDLRLVTFNRRAADLLNVPLRLLTQRPTFDEIVRCQIERGEITSADEAEESTRLWNQLASDDTVLKRRRPNDTVIEIRSNPLFQGGFVCTYTDVTAETKAIEKTLAAKQATERAYAELKETQASLVQAEKMASLGLLVAGIAHEINTPVGIAYSCASHLASQTGQLVTALEGGALKKSELLAYGAAAAESTRLMASNLSRAAELIRSFKLVAVDQASAELRRFDLGIYIREVVTSLGPRLRTTPHRVVVTCPEHISINSYPGALSQVVTNLVMNALIHAFSDETVDPPEDGIGKRRAGTIAITVEASASRSDVDLSFTDDGKGIPAESIEKIFEPFFTTRRGSGGSGLGLHIVFNLVTQSLGGRISVSSTEGQGTTFHIRFPRDAPSRPPSADPAAAVSEIGTVDAGSAE